MPELLANPPSRLSRLSRQMRHAIQRGDWPVGASLPTTRALARQFSISLATVQVVLRELEQQGLIECRPRQGAIVKSHTPNVSENGVAKLRHVAIVGGFGIAATQGRETWAWRILGAIQNELAEHELRSSLVGYSDAADPTGDLVQRIEHFDDALVGVILFNSPAVHPLREHLDRIGIPWVMINPPDADSIHNFVAADNLKGCQLLGECLARMQQHHVLVLMAAGINNSQTERDKITGLLHGFIAAGAPLGGINYTVCGDYGSVQHHVNEYLKSHEPPQVIFALADEMASAAIAACADTGLNVPDDIRVVGGAGLDIAGFTRPTLTVVAQPMAEIGRQAAQMILEMMEKNTRRVDRRRIQGSFILRESLSVPPDIIADLQQKYPGMISASERAL